MCIVGICVISVIFGIIVIVVLRAIVLYCVYVLRVL